MDAQDWLSGITGAKPLTTSTPTASPTGLGPHPGASPSSRMNIDDLAPDADKPEDDTPNPIVNFFKNWAGAVNPIPFMAHVFVEGPDQVMKDASMAQLDQFKKAKAEWERGNHTGALGYLAAGFAPGVGPAAAAAGEQLGKGDISGGLGTAAGLLTPFGLEFARRAPIVQSAVGKAATLAADILDRGAERKITSVTVPNSGSNKVRLGNKMAEVAPDLLREPDMGAGSRAGLQNKVEAKLAATEKELIDAHSRHDSKSGNFDTQGIIEALKNKRAEFTSQPIEASRLTPEYTGQTSPASMAEGGAPITGELSGEPVVVRKSKVTNDPANKGRKSTKYVEETVTPQPKGATDTRTLNSEGNVGMLGKRGRPMGQEVVPEGHAGRVAQIDKTITDLEQLGPVTSFDALWNLRKASDNIASVKYSPSMTQDFVKASGSASGAADVSGVLRKVMDDADPGLKSINDTYHLYRTVNDVMKAAEEIERVSPGRGRKIVTGATAGASAYALTGNPVVTVASAILAPIVDEMGASGATTKIGTARTMARLADKLRSFRQGEIKAAELQTALEDANRATGAKVKPSVIQQAIKGLNKVKEEVTKDESGVVAPGGKGPNRKAGDLGVTVKNGRIKVADTSILSKQAREILHDSDPELLGDYIVELEDKGGNHPELVRELNKVDKALFTSATDRPVSKSSPNKPLSHLDHAAIDAVSNEAEAGTGGAISAWENAASYADQHGVSIDQFRAALKRNFKDELSSKLLSKPPGKR